MTIYELAWIFFIYAFLGWVLETVYAAFKDHHFRNRGFLNMPLCPIYGVGVASMQILYGAEKNFIFLMISCGVLASLLEFFTGLLLEKLFRKKWWDYSSFRFQLGGYVCLRFAVIWGIGGAAALRFLQPVLLLVIHDIPKLAGEVILIVLACLMVFDLGVVTGVIVTENKKKSAAAELSDGMKKTTRRMGKWITSHISSRMKNAFPGAKEREKKEKSRVFAEGCSFYKLVWLFAIGAFLGDVVETIFCRFTMGYWMSRSSVVWGPFSIVWGIGIVVLTIMLHPYRHKDDRYIFLFGTVVGGVYEYGCSVFTELVFGTVFWDYSGIPFNLAGRINLLFCFFWGVAAVLWIKILYPVFSRWIEKVKIRPGKIITWVFLMFFILDMLFSSMALSRFSERQKGIPAETAVGEWIDETFPDSLMNRVYPKAVVQK